MGFTQNQKHVNKMKIFINVFSPFVPVAFVKNKVSGITAIHINGELYF